MLPKWYKIDPRRFWTATGLVLYGFILFGFFLLWTFPFSSLHRRLIIALESALSSRVEVRRQSLLFPLGLQWEGVSVYLPDREAPLLLDRIQARAEPLSLLLGWRGEVDWTLRLSGVEGSGHLGILRRGDGLHFRLEESRAEIELESLSKKVAGRIHLKLRGEWGERGGPETAEANIDVERLVVGEVPKVVLPVLPVRFSRVNGRIILKDGRVVLEGVAAQGDQADLTGGGNILLRVPYGGSPLNLLFRVTPKGNLSSMVGMFSRQRSANDPLQVSIAGTLENPKVQVNGLAMN